jgi:hypothetical protein
MTAPYMNTQPTGERTMTIKILKNDTCPSISGKSTLKYQIGADEFVGSATLPVSFYSGKPAFLRSLINLSR